ncbi:MAG: DUF4292 domain-containing protein [Bacteroidales bacterium]|nr:DUF4292 domain-containing protein [Bacteroidales bacterium]
MKTNIFLFVGLLFILTFCSPKKELITSLPDLPESSERLYPFVLNRNIPFHGLTVKNIKIRYQTPDNTSRLYGALKMIRDSAILVSLRTSLGIEISRLLYTQDSVKMLDRRNDRAYFTDYRKLGEIAPLDFNFQMLQSIFSGNIPKNYRNIQMPEPEFVRDSARNEIYLGTYHAPEEKNFMNFYGWIYKDLARPSYIVFYREEQKRKFTVRYLDYQKQNSHILPHEVKVVFDQYNQTHKMNLKFNNISFDEFNNIHIDVPSSYKTIYK